MAPTAVSASTALSYPLYAADFDPDDSSFLLVGGGGGEGRSGVGNKITLLDTSSAAEIVERAEIELSRDEDSVTSLAVAQRSGSRSSLVLAGINSSSSAQKAQRNEHLRSFTVEYPSTDGGEKARASEGAIKVGSRTSLFSRSSSAKAETYQRVLRIPPLRTRGRSSRLAAIATGLADEGEIVLFNPASEAVRSHIHLKRGEEAADVDIIETQDGSYDAAYCTDTEVCLLQVGPEKGSKKKASAPEPRFIWITPHPDVFSPEKRRSAFRALRFLTPDLVLLLSNRPGRSGAEISVVRVAEKGMGEMVRRRRLHSSMKAATALDVAILDGGKGQGKQFVVAVAGQDISIALLTLNLSPSGDLSKFRSHSVLRQVHPLQMTRITFSNVITPAQPVSADPPPQYLKLASVSMGNTVVVHTLPLTPIPFRSTSPRYVLVTPSQAPKMALSALLGFAVLVLIAFLLQGVALPAVSRFIKPFDLAGSSDLGTDDSKPSTIRISTTITTTATVTSVVDDPPDAATVADEPPEAEEPHHVLEEHDEL
ncbi:MAG: hypothetical protein M1832_001580 [Thelocarpon impressellum]|nr:MAG: hypothetical protein M1832_001580 [Thelocarpon impressellum]